MKHILILLLLILPTFAASSDIDRSKVPIAVYDNIDTTKFLSIVDGDWYAIDRETMQPIGFLNDDFLDGVTLGLLSGLFVFMIGYTISAAIID